MSNKLLLYLVILLTLVTLVHASPSLDIIQNSIDISIGPDKQAVVPIEIKNTGTDNITLLFDISALDLTDKDGNKITLTFDPQQPTLQPNENIIVNMTAKADKQISFERFGGTLTVKDQKSDAQDTVTLNMDVQPDVCNFGVRGNELELTIKKPKSSDNFKPGDEITIEAKVRNIGKNSIRVQTEAFLFSKSKNIQDTASETKSIESDDDYTFTMHMALPADPNDIEKNQELKLVVKAFDEENEQRNCVIDSSSIKVKLEDKSVIVDPKESRIFPEIAACGDTVQGFVHVTNIGAKDNNKVSITLSNRELNIQQKSDVFSLQKFSDTEKNAATRQFEIKIPKNAREKAYSFIARVDYDGGFKETTLPFQIGVCTGAKQEEFGIAPVLIHPLEEQLTLKQGAITTIPVQVSNLLNDRIIYAFNIKNLEDIGQGSIKTVTLNPGQITTIFLDFSVNPDAPEGTYSGSILAKQQGATVASNTMIIEVKKAEQQEAATISPFIASIPLLAWIVLLIFAIGAIILAIMATIKYVRQ